MLHSVKKAVSAMVIEQSRKVRTFDPADAMTIVADPRGGSTWLFEVLQGIDKTATVYEPLHRDLVPEVSQIGIGWNQHIPEGADWPEAKELFQKIYSGKLLNHFIGSYTKATDYLSAERLLIKFVRAKNLLPWLLDTIELRYQPIVMLRHPMAMTASMMRHESWSSTPSTVRIPHEQRWNEMFTDNAARLEQINTIEERQVANWCLNNKYIIEHPRANKDWITIHYEHLLLHPEAVLTHIFERWGMEMPQSVIERIKLQSRTSRETIDRDPMVQLTKWQERFEPEMIDRMQNILDYFGIDLYSSNPMPNLDSKGIGFVPPMS